METKNLVTVLVILLVVLLILFGFSVYESLKQKEEQKYTVEEVIEPEDLTPEEEAEIPTIEETEEEVELLSEVTIEIKDWKFYPDKITIIPGTKVTWVNNDMVPHKVVAYDRLFYGARLNPGDTYSFTFTKVGSHRYFDAIFPKSGKGTIIVQEEPLPLTGGVIGINLTREEANGKFALLVLLFVIMVLALGHGMYTHHNI